MKLALHPELLERIAAAYALGTLRGGARRRFEALAREQPAIGAAARRWQARLSGLTELQASQAPDPAVWTRIDNLLQAEKAARAPRRLASPAPRWWHSLALWRGAATAALVGCVVAVGIGWQAHRQQAAEIAALRAPTGRYVALLADDQAAPALLATFEPGRGELVLQRLGPYQEAADKSLQLWSLPPAGRPRSLGVLGPGRVLRLPADAPALREARALAVSLEPHGGVPGEGGPTGPVLFKGALVQQAL